MEVEQHIDARHRRGADVLEQLLGLRQRLLGSAHVDVDAEQPFGHGPLEHAPVTATLRLQGGFPDQIDDTGFFPTFDDHQRHAGGHQGLEFSGGGDVRSHVFHVRRTLAYNAPLFPGRSGRRQR